VLLAAARKIASYLGRYRLSAVPFRLFRIDMGHCGETDILVSPWTHGVEHIAFVEHRFCWTGLVLCKSPPSGLHTHFGPPAPRPMPLLTRPFIVVRSRLPERTLIQALGSRLSIVSCLRSLAPVLAPFLHCQGLTCMLNGAAARCNINWSSFWEIGIGKDRHWSNT
jgi:hypothetical protein